MPEQLWDIDLMQGSNVDIDLFKPVKIQTSKKKYKYYESNNHFMKSILLESCGKDDPRKCLECQEIGSNKKKFKCKKNILRINEEVKAVKKLVNVDNVVELIDYGIINGAYSIILSKYEIIDFRSFYSNLELTEIINLFIPLFNAIHELAQVEIAHRDLKHDNFLVRDKKIYITDFGISFDKELDDRINITGDEELLNNGFTPCELRKSIENHEIVESNEHFFKINVINLTRCLFEAVSYIEYQGDNYSSFTLYNIFNQIKNRHKNASDTLVCNLANIIYNNGYYNGNDKTEKLARIENGATIANSLDVLKFVSKNKLFSCINQLNHFTYLPKHL